MTFLYGRINLPREDDEMRVPGGKRDYRPQTITDGFPPEAVERLRKITPRRGRQTAAPDKKPVVTATAESSSKAVTTPKGKRETMQPTIQDAPHENGVGAAVSPPLTQETARQLYFRFYICESRSAAYCAQHSPVKTSSMVLIGRWLEMGLRIRNVEEAEAAEGQEGEYWRWSSAAESPPIVPELEVAAESPQIGTEEKQPMTKLSDELATKLYEEDYIGNSLSANQVAVKLNTAVTESDLRQKWLRLGFQLRSGKEAIVARKQRGQRWEWAAEEGTSAATEAIAATNEAGDMVTAGSSSLEEAVTTEPAAESPAFPMVTESAAPSGFLVAMPPDAPLPEMELEAAAEWFKEVHGRMRAMREELEGIGGVTVSGRAKLVINWQVEVEVG